MDVKNFTGMYLHAVFTPGRYIINDDYILEFLVALPCFCCKCGLWMRKVAGKLVFSFQFLVFQFLVKWVVSFKRSGEPELSSGKESAHGVVGEHVA